MRLLIPSCSFQFAKKCEYLQNADLVFGVVIYAHQGRVLYKEYFFVEMVNLTVFQQCMPDVIWISSDHDCK